jgi:arsenical pump membrane protein
VTGLGPLALATGVFVATLALVLIKPRGVHEAWWAVLGAVVALGLGLVRGPDVVDVWAISHEAMLFLLGLLVLSKLVEKSGFFSWAAVHAARRAGGDGRVLFRNVFLLGALITALLSLDTTALLLTPLVLAFVQRLRLVARPFVLLCALVANTGSLILPVSNLTNLVFVGSFGLHFGPYAAWMFAPQIVALAVTYALARRALGAELPERFDAELLGAPGEAIAHEGFFRATCAALVAVLAGYFLAPLVHLPAYAWTLVVSAALLAHGARVGRVKLADLRAISWGVFPFALGLFVVVRSFDGAGLARLIAGGLDRLPASPLVRTLAAAVGAAAASNVMNNLPAALLARSILVEAHASPAEIYGALIGVDVGPNLLAFASLATMLVLGVAREQGEPVSARDLLRVGLWVTPAALLASALVLALEMTLVR